MTKVHYDESKIVIHNNSLQKRLMLEHSSPLYKSWTLPHN
jgi:hypothetical protein